MGKPIESELRRIVILDAENGRVILEHLDCSTKDLEEEVAALAENHEIIGSAFEWMEFNVVEDWR